MENKLELIVDEECAACKRIEIELQVFIAERNGINLTVSLIGSQEYKKISIIPALLVEGKLFCYGEVDFTKLNKKLSA